MTPPGPTSSSDRGGPAVTAPACASFGSRLIASGLLGQGGVELDWAAQGLTARVSAALTEAQAA